MIRPAALASGPAPAGADHLHTRTVIAATGLRDDLPDIPGLAKRWGRSVLHCPYCHGNWSTDTKAGGRGGKGLT